MKKNCIKGFYKKSDIYFILYLLYNIGIIFKYNIIRSCEITHTSRN